MLVRRTFPRIPRIGRTPSLGDRQCDCAERTGELVVFTCPVCMGWAKEQILRLLTEEGIIVTLDESGSVSGTVEVEESRG